MKKRGNVVLFFIMMALLPSTIFSFSLLAALWDGTNLQNLKSIKDYRPLLVTEVFSRDGYKIGEFFKERRYLVTLDQVPPVVLQAFIASEDLRFFEHGGVDLFSVTRAFLKNMKAGKMAQGGSTITQQVARSLMGDYQKTLQRKMKEAMLAWRLEKNFSKKEILYLYLNQIYLGEGAYGIEAAARTYFGKSVGALTLAEASLLAGLPQAPSRYSPLKHPAQAKARQKYVLEQMVKGGFIKEEAAGGAYATPLTLRATSLPYENIAPYFVEYVRQILLERFGHETVYGAGLKVYTTLSASEQKVANGALLSGLREVDRRQNHYGPLKHLQSEREKYHFIEECHLQFGDGKVSLPSSEEARRGKEREAENLTEIVQLGSTPLSEGKVYPALIVHLDRSAKLILAAVGHTLGVIPFSSMPWIPAPAAEGEPQLRHSSEILKTGDVILVSLNSTKAQLSSFLLPDWVSKKSPVRFNLEPDPHVQGALLAIDLSGAITALIGGRDFEESEFNRATQALRQPGSTFKPIVYAAALDRDYTPVSVILDAPLVYEESLPQTLDSSVEETTWKPHNFGEQFYGDTLFRTALIESRNIPTIRIAQSIGLDYVIEYAQRLGIRSPLSPDLSLALGSSAVTLKELCTAYGVFASGGFRPEPYAVTEIKSAGGKSLYRYLSPPREPVISSETAFLMTHLLQDVIQYGTGRAVSRLGRPAAGKTGTSSSFIDAWFIGYTPHLITGTWVGYDDRESLGKGETGARAAAPIWLSFMLEATRGHLKDGFSIPEGIVFTTIEGTTGAVVARNTPHAVSVAFKAGTEPAPGEKQTSRNTSGTFFKDELLP